MAGERFGDWSEDIADWTLETADFGGDAVDSRVEASGWEV